MRDEIKTVLVEQLQTETTAYWLAALQEAGLRAMEVLNWDEMTDHLAYNALQMEQTIHVADKTIVATRHPTYKKNKKYTDEDIFHLNTRTHPIKQ